MYCCCDSYALGICGSQWSSGSGSHLKATTLEEPENKKASVSAADMRQKR